MYHKIRNTRYTLFLSQLYTYWKICKNDRKKRKVYRKVFRVTFFEFAFRISHQGRHSRENSKDFVVYFFAALIKHEIRMKWETCIASVSYFVACFAKTFAKYEKWLAGHISFEFRVLLMPRKNKPQNPLTFCANSDPGAKCRETRKKWHEIPPIHFSFFAFVFAYFKINV